MSEIIRSCHPLLQLSLFSRLSANTLFTPRSLFLTSQCRFNGQELLLRRDRSRWCPRLRRRHEVADSSRPHHKHHLRCQIQNFWMRQCDREFELSDRIGEGNDLGRCGESEEYGDCEGIMLAACEMYVVVFHATTVDHIIWTTTGTFKEQS